MPFTAAHPAIVVPLARLFPRWTALPALVVGSMAPDFEYFVHLRPLRTIGHDPLGVALLDVPGGLAVLFLFDRLVKGPLFDLFPDGLRARVHRLRPPIAFAPARRLAAIVASLAIGALSHIGWDAFTHADGPFVRAVPALSATALTLRGHQLKVFKVLQHGSTAVGLGLLGWWSARWLVRQPDGVNNSPLTPRQRHGVVVRIALAALVGGPALASIQAPRGGWVASIGCLIVSTIAAFFAAVLIYCAATRLRRHHGPPGPHHVRP